MWLDHKCSNHPEEAKEWNQSLYICFIDFKAFDPRSLWLVTLEMGFPPYLVELLLYRYRQQWAAARTANLVPIWFQIKKGIQQGCKLPPYPFKSLAEQAMWRSLQGFTGDFRFEGETVSMPKHAYDIIWVATSPEELQDLVSHSEKAAKEYNVIINAAKTKGLTNSSETL